MLGKLKVVQVLVDWELLFTAGFIDTGFKGHVTLELANLSNNEVVVYPMQRVCQLVFENCICTDKLYNGKYQDQIMPQPSLINLDKD